MGALKRAGVWLGLVEDEDDRAYAEDDRRYDDRGYDDYEADAADAPRLRAAAAAMDQRAERASVRSLPRPSAPMMQDNLALAPQAKARERVAFVDDDAAYRITTLHPTTYNEARTIGEHFREGTPVIMNLTEMDESDAKRLVDFAAGLAFGLRGTIERVTNRVFLLSPANVTVTAEDKAKIAEGGFFNQS